MSIQILLFALYNNNLDFSIPILAQLSAVLLPITFQGVVVGIAIVIIGVIVIGVTGVVIVVGIVDKLTCKL